MFSGRFKTASGFESQTATMSNTQGFCCDDETGETIVYNINNETGEPALDQDRRAYKTDLPGPKSLKYNKFPKGYITKTRKFQALKANIIAGSNPISYRLLLVPTVMIFPGLVCTILMLLEIYLHIRCHKKNKALKDPMLYYRSPFHAVTSAFCGECRESDSASKFPGFSTSILYTFVDTAHEAYVMRHKSYMAFK